MERVITKLKVGQDTYKLKDAEAIQNISNLTNRVSTLESSNKTLSTRYTESDSTLEFIIGG